MTRVLPAALFICLVILVLTTATGAVFIDFASIVRSALGATP